MIEFFTEPWNMKLLNWTMVQLVSALLQIGVGYFVINVGLLLALDKK
jgi:hypothetical protein